MLYAVYVYDDIFEEWERCLMSSMDHCHTYANNIDLPCSWVAVLDSDDKCEDLPYPIGSKAWRRNKGVFKTLTH